MAGFDVTSGMEVVLARVVATAAVFGVGGRNGWPRNGNGATVAESSEGSGNGAPPTADGKR